MHHPNKGFTLLELLVVISILATLAAVTVVVLNPSELLKRARDSQRLNDLAAVTSAISFYMVETTSPILDGGTNSLCDLTHVWVTATPAATTGFTVATSSTPGGVGGSGWIKVNLSGLSTGSPLPAYPVDPTNSSPSFYTYACDGSPIGFQLIANLESTQNSGKELNDGGQCDVLYESGTIGGYLTGGTASGQIGVLYGVCD